MNGEQLQCIIVTGNLMISSVPSGVSHIRNSLSYNICTYEIYMHTCTQHTLSPQTYTNTNSHYPPLPPLHTLTFTHTLTHTLTHSLTNLYLQTSPNPQRTPRPLSPILNCTSSTLILTTVYHQRLGDGVCVSRREGGSGIEQNEALWPLHTPASTLQLLCEAQIVYNSLQTVVYMYNTAYECYWGYTT